MDSTWVLGHFDARLATFVCFDTDHFADADRLDDHFDDADRLDASLLQYLVSWIFGYLFALMLASILLLARSAARSDNWTFRRYDTRLDVSLSYYLLHCC